MQLDELIDQLCRLRSAVGNAEVLITDGHESRCYRGDYLIGIWTDHNGITSVDIGIGGCLEDPGPDEQG